MMDDYYKFDEVKIDEIKKAVPWMKDPRYFKRVKISPSAIVKMMTHAQSGVDKGTRRGGKPIEVMGLLLGRPDVSDPQCLIIADAQALPCEGFETSVVANDESVTNYMIDLGEINEETRNEHFCGWYHTHPFDLDVNSHCYLSNTDISTQIQWQRAEDPYGNPYLAIVIDPLRSIAKGRPELMAFRTYPPEYTHTNLNELPDGTVEYNDKVRIAKYGVCWNRYYALEISYYMSDLSASTLNILKNNFLWMNTFTDASCLTNTGTGILTTTLHDIIITTLFIINHYLYSMLNVLCRYSRK
jgi:COP9 signalosome complex subunit 5